LTLDELLLLTNAVNEAIGAVDDAEFATRLGTEVSRARALQSALAELVNEREPRMPDGRLSTEELLSLADLCRRASGAPWQAVIEGRDQTSGSSFIMVGPEDDRADDMYVSRDAGPASVEDLGFIAAARNYLPRLVEETMAGRARAGGAPPPAERTGYGESAVAAVDWHSVEVLAGTGDDLAAALLELLRITEETDTERLWWRLENRVFAQNTVYGAAEETIDVLLAALADDRPPLVRSWIMELLFFLVRGGSMTDPSLPGRCRERARAGLWLLAQEARATSGPERTMVLAMVKAIDPRYAHLIEQGLQMGEQPQPRASEA
jgi:hypothetical protein